MKYVTEVRVQVWANIQPVLFGKRAKIAKGKVVESTMQKNGYAFIISPAKGWVDLDVLAQISIDDPLPLPPSSGVGWFTIRGFEKPKFYKPEGPNWGSFDIVWLSKIPKAIKPDFVKLRQNHIDYITYLNGGNAQAVKWLTDQDGTSKVLSVDEDGNYRCPVPCCSGNNLVDVLEWVNSDFARIRTVDINGPLPSILPPSLCHTWYGFSGDVYYIPQGNIGGVKYPLFFDGSTALIQRKGLKQVT